MKGRAYYLTVDMREDTGWGMSHIDIDKLDDYEEFLRMENVVFTRDDTVFTYWGYDEDDLADIVMLQNDILGSAPDFTYEDALDYVQQWSGNLENEDDDFAVEDFEEEDDWPRRENDRDDDW